VLGRPNTFNRNSACQAFTSASVNENCGSYVEITLNSGKREPNTVEQGQMREVKVRLEAKRSSWKKMAAQNCAGFFYDTGC
jgi:hypothetical protein